MTKRRMKQMVKREEGNAIIELALILPLLVLMLLAVVDLGLVLQRAMVVADSARAGAQFALPWANATNTTGMAAIATQSAGSLPGYQATAVIVCLCAPGGAASSCNHHCANGSAPAAYAQVTASASIPLIFGIQGFPATIPVRSTARARTPWTGVH